MITSRTYLFAIVLILIGASIYFFESGKAPRDGGEGGGDVVTSTMPDAETRIAEKKKQYSPAKEISSPDGFINTSGEPVTIGEFVGKKVVLLDIWTYSCINCQRTLPYLNDWHEKYADDGLVIIGLHTPEFEFEKKYENVLAAVKKYDIKYPVVLDNDFSTWNAYGNRYWPRKYLIDIDGFVVYDHIGEGAYDETEEKIQELLKERLEVLGMAGKLGEQIGGVSEAPDVAFQNIGSPEVYFGADRNEFLGNGTPGVTGVQTFLAPADVTSNTLYLSGVWDIQPEFAEVKQTGAKIIFKYNSRDVYFVASSEIGSRVRVLRDGKAIGSMKGEDVDASGIVTVKADRLYKLVEDSSYGEHTLELEILDSGLKAFTFTFG